MNRDSGAARSAARRGKSGSASAGTRRTAPQNGGGRAPASRGGRAAKFANEVLNPAAKREQEEAPALRLERGIARQIEERIREISVRLMRSGYNRNEAIWHAERFVRYGILPRVRPGHVGTQLQYGNSGS